jgi:hypothetical protein
MPLSFLSQLLKLMFLYICIIMGHAHCIMKTCSPLETALTCATIYYLPINSCTKLLSLRILKTNNWVTPSLFYWSDARDFSIIQSLDKLGPPFPIRLTSKCLQLFPRWVKTRGREAYHTISSRAKVKKCGVSLSPTHTYVFMALCLIKPKAYYLFYFTKILLILKCPLQPVNILPRTVYSFGVKILCILAHQPFTLKLPQMN